MYFVVSSWQAGKPHTEFNVRAEQVGVGGRVLLTVNRNGQQTPIKVEIADTADH
jgi:hypothetical protein